MIKRESKFELLRIIAIIMVLAIHTVAGMIQVAFPEKLTWKYCAIIYSISHTAVPIFIMLTGFFSYKSTTRVILKTKRLVVPYIAYFVLFLAYTMIFPPKGILLRDVFISQVFSFGTTNSSFYFGQMYYLYILLAVIILSPYINTLIENINKKSHRNLIIALVVLLFAIPTINAIFDVEVLFVFASSELKLLLPIFITYYIIGAYFSKYDVVIKKRVSLLIFLVGSILVYALSYFWSVYHPLAEFMIRLGIMEPYVLAKLNEGGGFSKQFMNYDSLLILFSSCGLLLFFKALKVKYSKIINYLASLTFGVYINHLFVRNFLVKYLPSIDGIYGVSYIRNSALLLLLTVIFSFIIEALRRLLVTSLKKMYRSRKKESKAI